MSRPAPEPLLRAERLRVSLDDGTPVVEDVSLAVGRGEILGLVGESGSGKTTLALALLGYARPGVRIAGGEVAIAGQAITPRPERAARRLRGRVVSYVPQDPATALNPSFRVGFQIREVPAAELAGQSVADVLRRVHLPDDREFQRRYPHQLSGGQQQRVMIAAAIVGEPPVVVFDEPTTGLDVVTQARVLDEIRRLREQVKVTMVYVSHDLAVVSAIADRVAVMYAGGVVEQGPADDLLRHPRHPYTRGLVESIPDHLAPHRLHGIPGVAVGPDERPPGCRFAPRCPFRVDACESGLPELEPAGEGREVRCIRWQAVPAGRHERLVRAPAPPGTGMLVADSLVAGYRSRRGGPVVAAQHVSFGISRGECVALVGESGSGKTTIARCVAGLHQPDGGRLQLDGQVLEGRAQRRTTEQRRRIQIVFQNPFESLNPRHRVRDAVARPAVVLRGLDRRTAAAEVGRLLEQVRLPARLAERYPGELSGGERQRVAIARALAAQPDLLVCDEVTSALDVSVQAAVIELLNELRQSFGLALLFISHDLGVVASIADRALVLEHGHVREEGPVGRLLAAPQDAYTRALVEAAPRIAVDRDRAGAAP